MPSRRWFLGSTAALAAGLASLERSFDSGRFARRTVRDDFGPPVSDPRGWLNLPAGFEYTLFSRAGETMDDGFFVPRAHDGMATFEGPNGHTVLVRNHEDTAGPGGAFGKANELLGRLTEADAYDRGRGRMPCRGGTTTLVFDTERQVLVEHWLSLACTLRNCSGGPTPWGSWLSCEEAVDQAGDVLERDHGFVFEVPSGAKGLAQPRPIEGMGRFFHEAVAIDPSSGVAFMTEDRPDGLFYRYVPEVKGDLHAGGKLQALRVEGAPSLDTRNWHEFSNVPTGVELTARWVEVDDPLSPNDDLRARGFIDGAARFARGEGMWFANGWIYFACTSGGSRQVGQIWRYRPSPDEGQRTEHRERGVLELFCEPNDAGKLDMCDNLTVSPWGDLLLCEDGRGSDRLVGITPDCEVYTFAENAIDEGEFTGVTFSPDGSTLFVNMQSQGATVAITGPWPKA